MEWNSPAVRSKFLPAVYVDTDAGLEEKKSAFAGGIVIVQAYGRRIVPGSWKGKLYGREKPALEKCTLTAIPYPYWNNRGEGEMLVWIKELNHI